MENGLDRLSTTDAEAVAMLFNQPGWALFLNYLRVKRRVEAAKLIYQLNVNSPSDMAEARAVIRFVDELLTETQEARKILASRLLDNIGQKAGSPYRADDVKA
jgi:hypothetical protein